MTHGQIGDRTAQALQPRQGPLPGGRVHQGRGDRLLRPHRAGDAAAPRRAGRSRSGASRTASTASSFFEKRCPQPPSAVGAGGARARRPQGRHRVLRARRARGAGVGGQPGGARAARADGPRRRPRRATDGRVRPRPRRRRPTSRTAAAIALADPRRARRRRARGVGQDVGLEGPAALRAGERPAAPTSTPRRSPSPSASCSSSSGRRRS